MIIHKPEIKKQGDKILVEARIEYNNPLCKLPDILWFMFPEDAESFVTKRTDGFLAAVLFLAMSLGEDINVKGCVSSKLLNGIGQFQSYFHFYFPSIFKKIKIICEDLESLKQVSNNSAVGCNFSGGVDSFYTLYSHLPEREPNKDYQITHLLFQHGLDIPLDDKITFNEVKGRYEKLAYSLNLGFLPVATNVRSFVSSLNWGIVHAPGTISAGLVLSNGISKLFISSSHSYNCLEPRGSNAITDHFLSTEELEVIHDGAHLSRVDKIRIIAEFPQTYDSLRVCWKNPNGIINCCRCEKCIRTMISLELCGILHKYTTFPRHLRKQDILFQKLSDENSIFFAKENLNYAIALKRKNIIPAIKFSILLNSIVIPFKKMELFVKAVLRELKDRIFKSKLGK